MANVKFKRGSQAKLNKYLYTYTGSDAVQAEEGSFYLTEDTNRLYIGKEISTGNIKAVPINQGAIPVSDVNHLPAPAAAIAGQFYYIVDNNILCVASEGQWVQINVNTNTDNYIDEIKTNASVATGTQTATIEEIYYNTSGANWNERINFIGDAGLSVSVTPNYSRARHYHAGTTYYVLDNGNYVAASTQPSNEQSVIASTYYIQRGYALTLTPPIYAISSAVNENSKTISLTVGDGTRNSTVDIQGGSNITVGQSGDTVTFNASDTTIQTVKAGSGNGPNTYEKYNSDGSAAATLDTKGFYVQLTHTNNSKKGASFNPQIRIGGEAAYQVVRDFDNGIATLPVYTTTEVDNKFRLFNAMEYQGVVNSTQFGTIRSSADTVKNGFVWMASEAISINTNLTATAGDLIIASGTEDADGFIDPTNITWQIVTSGASFDTQPIMDNEATLAHGFRIGKSTAGGGTAYLGTFQIAVNSTDANATQYLAINDTVTGTTAKTKIVRITHAETNPTTAAATAATTTTQSAGTVATPSSFNIPVPVAEYDAAGHITGVTTYLYQVVDTHVSITGHTLTATSSVKTQATITDLFKADGQNITATMNINSETIALGADNGALVMNIEWDTFN